MAKTITKKDSKANYNAIMFCMKAGAKESENYGLNALYVKKGQVVATDGHRLHYAPITNIPNGLYEYSKVKTSITLTRNTSIRYPDYEAVIPTTFKHETIVDNAELAHLARSAKIISTSNYQAAILTFNSGLKVQIDNYEDGNMYGETAISQPVDPELTIGLNIHYLIDALKGLGEQVTIGLQDDNCHPMIFKDAINTALIMPMRV